MFAKGMAGGGRLNLLSFVSEHYMNKLFCKASVQ